MDFHDYFLNKIDSDFGSCEYMVELDESFSFWCGYLQGLHDFNYVSDALYHCLAPFLEESYENNKKRFLYV